MRSLQRLGHNRPPSADQLQGIQQGEASSIQSRKKMIWGKRLRRLGVIAAIVAVCWASYRLLWQQRVVVDGLVLADTVTARPPASTRVTEVLVEPGQRVSRGDPLVRIEALDNSERRAAELRVEQDRLELQLVEAGGEVGLADLGRRADRTAEAELNAGLADADARVADATLSAIRTERETAVANHERARLELIGRLQPAEERLAEAWAVVDGAEAQLRLAQAESERQSQLRRDGITTVRDEDEARRDLERSQADVEAARSAARGLDEELASLTQLVEAEDDRWFATVREIEARIVSAARTADELRVRSQLWRQLAQQRRDLLPEEAGAGRELRELEAGLLRTQLAESLAELDLIDQRIGNLVLYAEVDGIVDRVYVRAGTVVESEAPLVSYYDPSSLHVVAYAEPDDAYEIRAGKACHFVLEGTHDALPGEVRSLGGSWVPCPRILSRGDEVRVDLRLPFEVNAELDALHDLRPNLRARIVLERGHEEQGEGSRTRWWAAAVGRR